MQIYFPIYTTYEDLESVWESISLINAIWLDLSFVDEIFLTEPFMNKLIA